MKLHRIKITAAQRGVNSRVELDGQELQGVRRVWIEVDASKPTTVGIELIPQIVEVEGDIIEGEIEITRESILRKRDPRVQKGL